MQWAAAPRLLIPALAALAFMAPHAQAATYPIGFRETVVFDGLTEPTAVKFADDGRVFVAEKSGRILVFSGLHDSTPSVFADLTTNVHNYWDRGLLGLELHPEFPAVPYVYVAYTHDAAIGGLAPRWGETGLPFDTCPDPPGATTDGCVVSGRLSRLEAAGDAMTGSERVLLEDWCQQYPSHTVGDLEFGPDGALYLSSGDGASFGFADYGQHGDPRNPCGDPPAGVGGRQSPPDAEGGALRSQDLRTPGDPVTLDGTIVRLDPETGAAMDGNPLALSADANARRVIAYGLRNPFRFTFKPGTNELWLGDVGSGVIEEVNRIVDPVDANVENFGWPCYEGRDRLSTYEAVGLAICTDLYASPGAVTAPFHSYRHDPDADVECPTGTAAIAGIEFYQGGTYVGYEGALFFADYAAQCIWVVRPGAGGGLEASAVETFASGLATPVDLEVGPAGDLYYVDIGKGSIRRIRFDSGNSAPTARITADPSSGTSPLTVNFDGSTSDDPNPHDSLTFAWDLDGDGDFDDSTAQRPSFVYARNGTYTVRLRVTDNYGETATAQIAINVANSAPHAEVVLPATSTRWAVGETLAFSATAYDADDGELPASAFSWMLVLHHCPATCHEHVVERFEGVTSGAFSAPDHEYPSHLELRLVVRDSGGLTDAEAVPLLPRTVELTIESSPAGLDAALGTAATTPFTRTVIVGSRNSLGIGSPQTFGGETYLFSSWSDGGPRSHEILAPEVSTSYRATFVANARPRAVLDAAPRSGPIPLTVTFDASASTDPDGHAIAYAWDLDGDGDFDDATSPRPRQIFAISGTHAVRVRVTDEYGKVDEASLSITAEAPPPNPPPPQPQPSRTPERTRCVVPKLVGRVLAAARRRLLAASCRLGRVRRVYSQARKGLVRSQNPRAGRRLPHLAKVAVVVSRGPARRSRRTAG